MAKGETFFTPNQIKIYSNTVSKNTTAPFGSRPYYECANAKITRGVTTAPTNIESCFRSFPEIETVAEGLGIDVNTNFWKNPQVEPNTEENALNDLLTGIDSEECKKIKSSLGDEWLGCLWGTPQASFSCVCPKVNEKFEAYLKHRLNIATFWNTPVETPVLRRKFLDFFKYTTKIELNVAGDFAVSPGTVVYIDATAGSRTPTQSIPSFFTGTYFVLAVKHIVTNSGTHEMLLTLSSIPPEYETTPMDFSN
jgi:hypothetical protein